MTPEKVLEVISRYRSLLSPVAATQGPFDKKPTPDEAISHLHGMLDKMEEMLRSVEAAKELTNAGAAHPDWDKANRWLGFIQGVFWLHGYFTLNQMRVHNIAREPDVVHGDFGALIKERGS